MVFRYEVYDDSSGELLFKMPFMDRTLREPDLFRRDGTVYKVESVLMVMNTTTQPQGEESEYGNPTAEIKVSVVT